MEDDDVEQYLNIKLDAQVLGFFMTENYPFGDYIDMNKISIYDNKNDFGLEFTDPLKFKAALMSIKKKSIIAIEPNFDSIIYVSLILKKDDQGNYLVQGNKIKFDLPPFEHYTNFWLYSCYQRDMHHYNFYAQFMMRLYYPVGKSSNLAEFNKRLVKAGLNEIKNENIHLSPNQIVEEIEKSNIYFINNKILILDVVNQNKYKNKIKALPFNVPEGTIFQDIHLRIWLNNLPFYIF